MPQDAASLVAPRAASARSDGRDAADAAGLHAPPLPVALGWAAVAGLAMSTQYLFQPFVWANWPWDDVLAGWLDVLRDRVVVAAAIAVAIVGADRLRARTPRARAAWLALAIAAGALAGEAVLAALRVPGTTRDTTTLLLRAAHWSAVAACIALVYGAWLRMVASRAKSQSDELRVADIERQVVVARLSMLRQQIEPHFLFNTLATVRRLHHAEAARGAQLLESFLDYLRRSLAVGDGALTTLASETALVRAYLEVAAVRMSGRLESRIDVPRELLACEVPALALATLVENAIKHGLAPKAEGGTIVLSARRNGDDLVVDVVDTGVGFSGSLGAGIGLANVRARLLTLYGERGVLALEGRPSGGVRAAITLPCTVREAA